MRTYEEEQARKEIVKMLQRERLAGFRSVVAVHRRIEPAVDLQRLWVRHFTECRILGTGHGAASGDIGKFWQVSGYSASGGPDIVYVP